jgi:hypothetical protein
MAPVKRRTAAADGSAAEPAATAATEAMQPTTASPRGWVTVDETDDYDAPAPAPVLHVALLAVAVAPLLVAVPPNVAIVLTPTLAILAGAYRSVKEAPPSEQMTQKDAMRFPLVGRCVAANGCAATAAAPLPGAAPSGGCGCARRARLAARRRTRCRGACHARGGSRTRRPARVAHAPHAAGLPRSGASHAPTTLCEKASSRVRVRPPLTARHALFPANLQRLPAGPLPALQVLAQGPHQRGADRLLCAAGALPLVTA